MKSSSLSLLLVLLLCVYGSFASTCSSDLDCNMAGICTDGACVCDPAFTGSTCESLNLEDTTFLCGEGSMCLDNQSTWGGHAVKADDGQYHLWGSLFSNNCPLASWLTNSVAVYASSPNATGPFTEVDVALKPRPGPYFDNATVHNVVVRRAPDGMYLMYYMGTSGESGHPCSPFTPESYNADMQRIGLATSKSPNGPWTRRDSPIMKVGPPGAWDSLFQTNPSAHVFPNGSVLLVYKGRKAGDFNGGMFTGTAWADHYTDAEYQRRGTNMPVPKDCEDAGVFLGTAPKHYHAVFHCGCAYKTAFSLDGITWNSTSPIQGWCDLKSQSGESFKLSRRERPQIITDDKTGKPLYIWTSALPDSKSVHEGRTFTLVTAFKQ